MSNLNRVDLTTFQSAGPISERVYETVKAAILCGQLQIGEILTEVSVAEHFRVSRTPVRDALRKLEEDGFLETIPRKGLRVRDIRVQGGNEIYDVAIALESRAAALAARNRSQEQLDELHRIQEQMTAPEIALYERSKLHHAYHVLIAQSSGNRYLCDLIRAVREKLLMLDTYQSSVNEYYRHSAEKDYVSALSHTRILDAIEAQDGEVAELLMRRHLALAQQAFNRDLAASELSSEQYTSWTKN